MEIKKLIEKAIGTLPNCFQTLLSFKDIINIFNTQDSLETDLTLLSQKIENYMKCQLPNLSIIQQCIIQNLLLLLQKSEQESIIIQQLNTLVNVKLFQKQQQQNSVETDTKEIIFEQQNSPPISNKQDSRINEENSFQNQISISSSQQTSEQLLEDKSLENEQQPLQKFKQSQQTSNNTNKKEETIHQNIKEKKQLNKNEFQDRLVILGYTLKLKEAKILKNQEIRLIYRFEKCRVSTSFTEQYSQVQQENINHTCKLSDHEQKQYQTNLSNFVCNLIESVIAQEILKSYQCLWKKFKLTHPYEDVQQNSFYNVARQIKNKLCPRILNINTNEIYKIAPGFVKEVIQMKKGVNLIINQSIIICASLEGCLTLSRAKTAYIDFTFKYSASQFLQLGGISCNDSISKKQRLCFYILMTNKDEDSYIRAFQSIKTIMRNYQVELNIEKGVMDFEKGLQNAWTCQICKKIQGCYFHFCQSCVKHLKIQHLINKSLSKTNKWVLSCLKISVHIQNKEKRNKFFKNMEDIIVKQNKFKHTKYIIEQYSEFFKKIDKIYINSNSNYSDVLEYSDYINNPNDPDLARTNNSLERLWIKLASVIEVPKAPLYWVVKKLLQYDNYENLIQSESIKNIPLKSKAKVDSWQEQNLIAISKYINDLDGDFYFDYIPLLQDTLLDVEELNQLNNDENSSKDKQDYDKELVEDDEQYMNYLQEQDQNNEYKLDRRLSSIQKLKQLFQQTEIQNKQQQEEENQSNKQEIKVQYERQKSKSKNSISEKLMIIYSKKLYEINLMDLNIPKCKCRKQSKIKIDYQSKSLIGHYYSYPTSQCDSQNLLEKESFNFANDQLETLNSLKYKSRVLQQFCYYYIESIFLYILFLNYLTLFNYLSF